MFVSKLFLFLSEKRERCAKCPGDSGAAVSFHPAGDLPVPSSIPRAFIPCYKSQTGVAVIDGLWLHNFKKLRFLWDPQPLDVFPNPLPGVAARPDLRTRWKYRPFGTRSLSAKLVAGHPTCHCGKRFDVVGPSKRSEIIINRLGQVGHCPSRVAVRKVFISPYILIVVWYGSRD